MAQFRVLSPPRFLHKTSAPEFGAFFVDWGVVLSIADSSPSEECYRKQGQTMTGRLDEQECAILNRQG
jgi:hypothetical protein